MYSTHIKWLLSDWIPDLWDLSADRQTRSSSKDRDHTWINPRVNYSEACPEAVPVVLHTSVPSENGTLPQFWLNVGPASETLDQHWVRIGFASVLSCSQSVPDAWARRFEQTVPWIGILGSPMNSW